MTEQTQKPPLFYRNVKLWCPQIKDLVTLCIETADKDSAIVKGKPFGCNLQNCSQGHWCLLTIQRLEVHI